MRLEPAWRHSLQYSRPTLETIESRNKYLFSLVNTNNTNNTNSLTREVLAYVKEFLKLVKKYMSLYKTGRPGKPCFVVKNICSECVRVNIWAYRYCLILY